MPHSTRRRRHPTILWILILFCGGILLTGCTDSGQEDNGSAREQTYEGVVIRVLKEGEREDLLQGEVRYQDLEVLITTGDREGERVTAEHVQFKAGEFVRYDAGDRLVLAEIKRSDGTREWSEFAVADVVRRPVLYALGAAFVLTAVLVAGWRGVTSLLGLAFTFVVILIVILPALLKGQSPVLVSVLGSILILIVTLPLTHGLHRQTLTAIGGTAASLILTGVLGWIGVEAGQLSGITSDEAFYLQVAQNWELNLRGIFLGSVIIGALGVLDDVTKKAAASPWL